MELCLHMREPVLLARMTCEELSPCQFPNLGEKITREDDLVTAPAQIIPRISWLQWLY